MNPALSVVADVAEGLLEAVCAELAGTPGGCPNRQCVVAGAEIAWDDCECGQLTVHVPVLYPSDNFPALKTEPPFSKCTIFTVAQFNVTMLRCVPTMDDQGNPPPCDKLTTHALGDLMDRWAMQRGASCWLRSKMPAARPWLLGQHAGVGGEGRCAGSELQVLVGFKNGCGC